MEAQLVDELPEGDWQYEPKWDGFRGVLENDGGELALWSRNGRPLLRYFPELGALGDLFPPHSALDGEIVIERDGRLEFDALQLRLHPAESLRTRDSAGWSRICIESKSSAPSRAITISPSSAEWGGSRSPSGRNSGK